MASVGSLVADLQLKSGQFVQELKKTNSRLGGFESRLNRVSSVGRRAFRGLAVAAGGVGLAAVGKQAIESTDQIGKLSTRLGATTESLSELGFAAELSGVQFRTLATGLQRMQRRVGAAALGTGEAKDALRELRIDATKLVQLDLDNQFTIIAEALSGLGLDADRTRLAMKLFDSEGVALVQMMQDGAAGIEEMRARARQLGIVISQDMANNAARAADNMLEFRVAIQALARTVAIQILPGLTDFVRWLARHLPEGLAQSKAAWNDFIAFFQRTGESFLTGLSRLVAGVAEFVSAFSESGGEKLQGVANTIGLLATSFGTAADASSAAAQAYREQAAALAALREQGAAGPTGDRATLADVRGVSAPEIKPKVKIQKVDTESLSGVENAISGAIQAGADTGVKGMIDAILSSVQRNLVGQLAKMIVGAFSKGGGGAGGGGGGFGGLIANFFGGFRTGGSFSVPGAGGPDSRLVAFKATPGERVTVQTPGQQRAGIGFGGAAGASISITQNINGSGANDAQRIAEQTAAAVRAELYDLKSRQRF